MQGVTQVSDALPKEVLNELEAIGRHIATSRKYRGLSQEDMAERMYVSRRTLYRLEKGDPTVGLSVLASALFVLGQTRRLRLLAEGDQAFSGPGRRRSEKAASTSAEDLDF